MDLGGQWPPLDFQKKNLVYIYSILFLAICFNKITLAPLNNIIDIFKCYKKNISPPIKIKPKQHTQKKKSEPVLMRYLCSLGVGNTQLIKGKKKKGISKF